MDCQKTGELIYQVRREKRMTQKALADQMNISDKTVSKWERGLGCPDVSLLPELSKILGIDIEMILSGSLDSNEAIGGNMRKVKFFVCNECGNIVTSTGETSISCCGRKIESAKVKKADEKHKLEVEPVETEWYISCAHEMMKDHFISFIAVATGDKLLLTKQYPEWNIELRLPKMGRGILFFYCTKDGLYSQFI